MSSPLMTWAGGLLAGHQGSRHPLTPAVAMNMSVFRIPLFSFIKRNNRMRWYCGFKSWVILLSDTFLETIGWGHTSVIADRYGMYPANTDATRHTTSLTKQHFSIQIQMRYLTHVRATWNLVSPRFFNSKVSLNLDKMWRPFFFFF